MIITSLLGRISENVYDSNKKHFSRSIHTKWRLNPQWSRCNSKLQKM